MKKKFSIWKIVIILFSGMFVWSLFHEPRQNP
jgi:hypothetical protein